MKKIFLPLLLIMLNSLIQSEDFGKFKQVLTVEEGLSQNSILSMEQDQYGFLWLGTQAGLTRWDGIQPMNYPREGKDDFNQGFVTLVKLDYWDRLWIVTNGGSLYLRIPEEDRFLNSGILPESLNGKIIQIISDPLRERLLLCTNEGSIYHWKPGDSFPSLIVTLENNPVTSFYRRGNDLYFGTEKGWYTLRNENTIVLGNTFPPPWIGLTHLPIYDLRFHQGNLYAARGEEGLTIYYPGRRKPFQHLENLTVYQLEIDIFDRLVGLGDDREIIVFDPETNHTEYHQQDLFSPRNLLKLHSGQIVSGSSASGLWINDPYRLRFQYWGDQEQNIHNEVMSLEEDAQGNFWLATYNSGLFQINNEMEVVKHFSTNLGTLPSDNLKHMIMDEDGILWIASYDKGFFSIDTQTGELIDLKLEESWANQIADLRVNHIYEDSRKRIWISSDKGVLLYNKHTGHIYALSDQWNSSYLGDVTWCVLEDKFGQFWIGQEDQLLRLNSTGEVQSSQGIRQGWFLYADNNGLIFVGTPSGMHILNRYGQILPFPDLGDILLGKSIYGVQQDSQENYWITSNDGIYWWNQEIGQIQNFKKRDGLLSQEFNLYSIGELEDNRLYFGSIEGVHFIDPREIHFNVHPPQIFLDQIWIDNTDFFTHQRQNPQDHPSISPRFLETLEIHPREKFLTIGFHALDFHYRKSVTQEYRMLGLKDHWIDISQESRVNFVNLPPGEYQFELRAKNDSQSYSHIRSLEIHVLPPLQKTLWFRIFMAVLLLSITALVVIYIRRLSLEVNRRRLAESRYSELNSTLEEQVITRTSELQQTLEQLKQTQEQVVQQEKMSSLGQVVAGVAHEINTPLGVAVLSNSIIKDRINNLTKAYQMENLTKEDLEEALDDLNNASERMTYNLDRAATLVSNFKQVAVEKNLKDIIEFDLCGSIRSLTNSLFNEFKRRKVTLNTHLPVVLNIFSYPGDISQVITNIIMNSLIHGFKSLSEKEKLLTIALSKKERDVTLRIRDNGIGMDEEVLSHIFEPFFTTNREGGGTGLGLNIVYNIVKEKLKGELMVESSPGQGTEFIIILPQRIEA